MSMQPVQGASVQQPVQQPTVVNQGNSPVRQQQQQGQPVAKPVAANQGPSRTEKYTAQFVNWVRNPDNEKNRNVAHEFLVSLTVLVATVVAIVTPIIGWAALYYTAKEYNTQVANFAKKHVEDKNEIAKLKGQVAQLDGNAKIAKAEIDRLGTEGAQRTKTLQGNDAGLRQAIEKALAEAPKGRSREAVRAVLNNVAFKA